MSTHEQAEKSAAERLAGEEQKRDERVRALPELERHKNEAFRAVQPKAEATLEQLQDRATIARDVQQEKMQAQRERDQTRELKLSREAARKTETEVWSVKAGAYRRPPLQICGVVEASTSDRA